MKRPNFPISLRAAVSCSGHLWTLRGPPQTQRRACSDACGASRRYTLTFIMHPTAKHVACPVSELVIAQRPFLHHVAAVSASCEGSRW